MSRRALSATRTADLLNFLAAHPGETFGYAELSQRLQINLASMHSLLTALSECGYLVRNSQDRRYALGPTLVAMGDAALRANPAVDETRLCMRELSRALDVESVAFVRAGHDTLCIARAGPMTKAGQTVHVGQRVPLMAPLASVYVAWAEREEIEQWLLRGEIPRHAQARQHEALEQVRERGYSVGLEVEGRQQLGALLGELSEDPHSATLRREMREVIQELGLADFQFAQRQGSARRISTITAPVFDHDGRVDLSITLQVFRRDVNGQTLRRFGEPLLAATHELTQRIGGHQP